MDTVTLKITGMTCMGCVNSVKRVLQAVNGVDKVEVTLDPGQAQVEYDPAAAGPAQLRAAIEDAGYEVA